MNYIFKCKREISAPSFPMCDQDLALFGLELKMVAMESLVQEPRGIGPFFVPLPHPPEPNFYFRMGIESEFGNIRSMYVPSFRKNDVIFHSLAFKNFLGKEFECTSVKPVQFDELERLKKSKKNYTENIITEQTDAQRILTTVPSPVPIASRFLVDIVDTHKEILRSSVFAEKDQPAEHLRYNQELFNIKFPGFLNQMVGLKYPDFNMLNTIWLGVIYHLYPETINYQSSLLIKAGYNCELIKDTGLVATRDIFVGEQLILKDKIMSMEEMMCYLPPPAERALKRRAPAG